MKKLKIFALLGSWALFALAFGCGGGSDEDPAPSQQDINALFTVLEQDVQNNGGTVGSTCPTDCADLQFDVTALTGQGTSNCQAGTIDFQVSVCDSNGSFTLTVTFTNCSDGTHTLNGSVTVTVNVTNGTTTATVNTSGLTVDQFNFSTNNASVTVPCSNGSTQAATCSGSVSSGGETCTLNTDCSGCQL